MQKNVMYRVPWLQNHDMCYLHEALLPLLCSMTWSLLKGASPTLPHRAKQTKAIKYIQYIYIYIYIYNC